MALENRSSEPDISGKFYLKSEWKVLGACIRGYPFRHEDELKCSGREKIRKHSQIHDQATCSAQDNPVTFLGPGGSTVAPQTDGAMLSSHTCGTYLVSFGYLRFTFSTSNHPSGGNLGHNGEFLHHFLVTASSITIAAVMISQ